MLNRLNKTALFCIFSLLTICPVTSFAWDDGEYWDYHGSGRDHPYSYYIDQHNYIGYADYSYLQPDYLEAQQLTLAPATPAVQSGAFTVNIPNKNGGYTPVVIKRSGNGFTGPQGEYYPEFPKIFQLEIMYGH